jgi:hypothetical protein
MVSKIETFGLQDIFISVYRECKTYRKTAEKLSMISGKIVSKDVVSKYHHDLENEAKTKIDTQEVLRSDVVNRWIQDENQVLGAYQEIVDIIRGVLSKANTDEKKIAAVPVALKSLERAMNMHNIGVVKNSQTLNVQNNILISDFKKEIGQIIIEETNDEGGLEYRERIINRIGRLGGST